ncbi:uncharacterized protein [Drosophila pseudoobscura]|uniref:Uncharacterized protein n=1 Tax=Drosophila pseudoobscura pseudoobscura TaxID=46245 RepID=A0A6I8VD42_DROPS|nr:uncharacterized protein LOC26533672 [Drosophila pseudoobscura]
MLLVTILIGVLLAAPVHPQTDSVQRKLGYNPNYDVWYLMPPAQVQNLTPTVMKEYQRTKDDGGVCIKDNIWIYCRTGKPLN